MIADIRPEHHAQILKMNTAFVHWLSPLDVSGLKALLSVASYAREIEQAEGVLIGYGHDADYDHKNLSWLRARFPNFYYIDRVIVDAAAHGKGHARSLYQDFEQQARKRRHSRLVCEVNIEPNNPGSHSFHQHMGFLPVGDAEYPQNKIAVRYYEKRILP